MAERESRGKLRRYVKLWIDAAGVAVAALEDEAHAFQIKLEYKADKVSSVKATWYRHPTSTCTDSKLALEQLVGASISASPVSLRDSLNAFKNCTHLFDISGVLIAFVWQFEHNNGPAQQFFQALVYDADQQGIKLAELYCDQELVLSWQVDGMTITAPAPFDNQSWYKGFAKWLSTRFYEMNLAQIIILQKAVFVSMARGLDHQNAIGKKALDIGHPLNSCFALDEARAQQSIRIDTRKDFSDTDKNMLQFLNL